MKDARVHYESRNQWAHKLAHIESICLDIPLPILRSTIVGAADELDSLTAELAATREKLRVAREGLLRIKDDCNDPHTVFHTACDTLAQIKEGE